MTQKPQDTEESVKERLDHLDRCAEFHSEMMGRFIESQDRTSKRVDDLIERANCPNITAWLALCISIITLLCVAFGFVPQANAQSRDLTGGEILQHYNTDGPAHDISKMYIAGVIDGMSVSGVICPPADRRKADFVQQVVYNLGANEQLHERRFDIAVSSAAIMAYPCGDPA